jgi:signal transduction histidine kinase
MQSQVPPTRSDVAAVAHELRNAIAPLGNALELLDHGRSSPQLVSEALPVARRQLRTLTRLVNDLLDSGRVMDRGFRLDVATACMQDVIEEALHAMGYECRRRGIEVSVGMPVDPVYADVDAARIQQVLANVLGNAAKFTPRDGRITLTLCEMGSEALIEISDTGAGIDPEHLERIFAMFEQETHTRHMNLQGCGMGLALARRLVELHGGKLSAHSDGRGRGSTFQITLPLGGPIAG